MLFWSVIIILAFFIQTESVSGGLIIQSKRLSRQYLNTILSIILWSAYAFKISLHQIYRKVLSPNREKGLLQHLSQISQNTNLYPIVVFFLHMDDEQSFFVGGFRESYYVFNFDAPLEFYEKKGSDFKCLPTGTLAGDEFLVWYKQHACLFEAKAVILACEGGESDFIAVSNLTLNLRITVHVKAVVVAK